MKIGNFDILLWWGIAAIICVVCESSLYVSSLLRGGRPRASKFIERVVINIVFAPACLLGWLGAALLWFNEKIQKIRRYD